MKDFTLEINLSDSSAPSLWNFFCDQGRSYFIDEDGDVFFINFDGGDVSFLSCEILKMCGGGWWTDVVLGHIVGEEYAKRIEDGVKFPITPVRFNSPAWMHADELAIASNRIKRKFSVYDASSSFAMVFDGDGVIFPVENSRGLVRFSSPSPDGLMFLYDYSGRIVMERSYSGGVPFSCVYIGLEYFLFVPKGMWRYGKSGEGEFSSMTSLFGEGAFLYGAELSGDEGRMFFLYRVGAFHFISLVDICKWSVVWTFDEKSRSGYLDIALIDGLCVSAKMPGLIAIDIKTGKKAFSSKHEDPYMNRVVRVGDYLAWYSIIEGRRLVFLKP